jgi:hypothetical protein
VRSFYADWADGHAGEACKRLTTESRRGLIAASVDLGRSCPDVLHRIWAMAQPFGGTDHWKRSRVGRVRFDGRRAFVRWESVTPDGDQGTWTREVDGRWLVDIAWR